MRAKSIIIVHINININNVNDVSHNQTRVLFFYLCFAFLPTQLLLRTHLASASYSIQSFFLLHFLFLRRKLSVQLLRVFRSDIPCTGARSCHFEMNRLRCMQNISCKFVYIIHFSHFGRFRYLFIAQQCVVQLKQTYSYANEDVYLRGTYGDFAIGNTILNRCNLSYKSERCEFNVFLWHNNQNACKQMHIYRNAETKMKTRCVGLIYF